MPKKKKRKGKNNKSKKKEAEEGKKMNVGKEEENEKEVLERKDDEAVVDTQRVMACGQDTMLVSPLSDYVFMTIADRQRRIRAKSCF